MPSPFDTILADEWSRCFDEFKQTVIRRIGGQDDRTEEVEAVVEFDETRGLVETAKSEYFDFAGLMDIPVGQANSLNDTWVIDGEVFTQQGEAIGKDGATKTVQLLKRKGIRAREPRLSGR